ncbi:hypothetical protein AMS68_004055 [Peltaster fructicola]|uniref:3-hydroxyacyl-CoA dehydrogenase NAD binding domain-containing protein n=1 Tax=Peltaster fructicola TaxID=286661 RepID=A0A6H0XVA0_9PEZI|nr:hypothetical protein AMS68_004055 [Peltaster fructicola]
MTTRRFKPAGGKASEEFEIDIGTIADIDALKQVIGGLLGVVKPEGLTFQHSTDESAIEDLKGIDGKDTVLIRVNGHVFRELPGPTLLPLVGSYFWGRLFDKYGPIFRTINYGALNVQTNDPELAEIIFAESEFFSKEIVPSHPLYTIKNSMAGVFVADTSDPAWKLVHKFLPPAFGPKAVRHYAPIMNGCIDETWSVFDKLEASNEAWNVYQYMLKLSSGTVAKIVLGKDYKHFEDIDSPLAPMIMHVAESLSLTKKIAAHGAWYNHLPFGDPARLRFLQDSVTKELVDDAARARSSGTEDLPLQDAALKAANVIDYLARAVDSSGAHLPTENMIPALLVASGAGFTTTSSLLSWLIYCLTTYPNLQARLLQELIDHDITDTTNITAEMIDKMTELDKIVKETQRRHNPSFQPGRTAQKDLVLPGGYRVTKGTVVIAALHHIHNNPKVWDRPEYYDPDRWGPDTLKGKPKATYIPFAMGQRMCIGFNFALLEVKIFMCKFVYRYHWEKEGDITTEYDPWFQLIRPNNLSQPLYSMTSTTQDNWQPPTNWQSRPVCVLGGGVLGRRIAACFVAAGHHVRIRDPSQKSQDQALQFIHENITTFTALTHHDAGSVEALEDLQTAVKDCWLIFEAVPEILSIKESTFLDLEKYAPKDCILATNSSSYKSSDLITKLQDDTKKRVLNTHYMMPPEAVIVELMTSGYTSPGIFPFLEARHKEAGLHPIVALRESTGFIFNRIWAAIKREVLSVLAEGVATPETIDKMWIEQYVRQEIGPCALMDKVGLDVVEHIEEHYIKDRHLADGHLKWLQQNYISKGMLGLKSGNGGLYPVPAPGSRTKILLLNIGLATAIDGNGKFPDFLHSGQILSFTAEDPSSRPVEIIGKLPCPDGIDISQATGRMYWTNMGDPKKNDGSVQSAKIDGTDVQDVVPFGKVHTPKQLTIDHEAGKIYYCDREGLSIYRVNFDGSELELLYQTGDWRTEPEKSEDAVFWPVGVTLSKKLKKFFWTQKGYAKGGTGRIFSAGLELPAGMTAANRNDVEVVVSIFRSALTSSSMTMMECYIGPIEESYHLVTRSTRSSSLAHLQPSRRFSEDKLSPKGSVRASVFAWTRRTIASTLLIWVAGCGSAAQRTCQGEAVRGPAKAYSGLTFYKY